MCPPGPSSHRSFGGRPFTTPGHVGCARRRAAQGAKALVGRVAHQGFEAQAYGLGIRSCTASHPRLFEEFVIDVKCFLHTSNSAIKVWLSEPYCEPSA